MSYPRAIKFKSAAFSYPFRLMSPLYHAIRAPLLFACCGRPPRREETNDETLRGAANFVDNQASWRTEETDPRCSFSTLDDFGQECKALTGQQVEERTPLAADTVNREERDQLFIPSDRAPTLLFVTPNEQTAATA